MVEWVLSMQRKGFDMCNDQRNREAQAWKLGVRYSAAGAGSDAAEVLFHHCLWIQREGKTIDERVRVICAWAAGRDGVEWKEVAA